MKLRKLTDPFTGAPIEAMQMDDHLTFTSPLNGGQFICRIDNGCISLPLGEFDYVELMDSQDAAMMLHVSRQRISQLVDTDVLKPIYLGKTQYFSKEDVLNYKKERKPGRPKGKMT